MDLATFMGGSQEITTAGTPPTVYPRLGRCVSVTPHADNGEIKLPALGAASAVEGADQLVLRNTHATWNVVLTTSTGTPLVTLTGNGVGGSAKPHAIVSLTRNRWFAHIR